MALERGELGLEPFLNDRNTAKADEIARSVSEIEETTKAYVGPLVNYDDQRKVVPIFDLLPKGIEHVYVSYPEGRIIFRDVTIGDKNPQELENALDNKKIKKINVDDNARYLLRSEMFAKSIPEQTETVRTAKLRVRYLDLPGNPTTDQVYGRIEELGAKLCLGVVGPQTRLDDIDQPLGNYYWIAMEQIIDRHGRPIVFGLRRRGDGLWFHADWAGPGDRWNSERQFVVSLRKYKT